VDGLYNYAHDALDKWAAGAEGERVALRWEGEEGTARALTYRELQAQANRFAHALRELGVGKGDRVGVFMPMIVETAVTVLACAKIGAIFTPIFSGYAAPAVAARLNDCTATVLVTADGFYRRGRAVAMKQTADEAVLAAPSVHHLVVVRRIGCEASWLPGRDRWWGEIAARQSNRFETVRTGAGEPYMIICTSGTTGRPIINYSGGTEISGGVVGCSTITPLNKPCSFIGPIPGMAADVVDDAGNSVRGQVGELVLRGPWPGIAHGFWNDEARYLDTYWSRLPGIWVHGDWVEIDEDGFWYIRGRSDDTIKTSGKRVGPAEVGAAAMTHARVAAAAAVGVPHPLKGEVVVVFAVARPATAEDPAQLLEEIAGAVTQVLGKTLKPDRVHLVADLPRTRNGKILRRVIRAGYLHLPLGDLSSLENPEALEEIARCHMRNP